MAIKIIANINYTKIIQIIIPLLISIYLKNKTLSRYCYLNFLSFSNIPIPLCKRIINVNITYHFQHQYSHFIKFTYLPDPWSAETQTLYIFVGSWAGSRSTFCKILIFNIPGLCHHRPRIMAQRIQKLLSPLWFLKQITFVFRKKTLKPRNLRSGKAFSTCFERVERSAALTNQDFATGQRLP